MITEFIETFGHFQDAFNDKTKNLSVIELLSVFQQKLQENLVDMFGTGVLKDPKHCGIDEFDDVIRS